MTLREHGLAGLLVFAAAGTATAAAADQFAGKKFVSNREWNLRMDLVALYPGQEVKEGATVTIRCGWTFEPSIKQDEYVTVDPPFDYSVAVWHIWPNGKSETLKTVPQKIEKGQYTRINYTGDKFLSAKKTDAELTATWIAKGAGSHSLGCEIIPGPQIHDVNIDNSIATNENNNRRGARLQVIGMLTPGQFPSQAPTCQRLTIISPTRGMTVSGPLYLHVCLAKSVADQIRGGVVQFEWEQLAGGKLWLAQPQLIASSPWTGENNAAREVIRQVSGLRPGEWRVRARMAGASQTDWVLYSVK